MISLSNIVPNVNKCSVSTQSLSNLIFLHFAPPCQWMMLLVCVLFFVFFKPDVSILVCRHSFEEETWTKTNLRDIVDYLSMEEKLQSPLV